MSKFKTAYDTTIGKSLSIRNTERAIMEADVNDGLLAIKSAPGQGELVLKKIIDPSTPSINTFLHPIYIKQSKVESLYADFRIFSKPVNKTRPVSIDNYMVTNPIAAELASTLMLLTAEWIKTDSIDMKINTISAGKAFVTVISNQISHAYVLNGEDMNKVRSILAAYYNDLHYDSANTPSKMLRLKNILTYSGVSSNYVTTIIDDIPLMDDMNALCTAIAKTTTNVNLSDFNMGVLLSLVSNVSYGYNIKELLAVAMEHPPTWIALVAVSADNKAYKRTILSNNLKGIGSKGKAELEAMVKYILKINSIYNQD